MNNKNTLTWNIILLATPIVILSYIIDEYDLIIDYELLVSFIWVLGAVGIVGLILASIVISIEKKDRPSRWKILIICFYIILSSVIYFSSNGGFWVVKLIDATFLDDRSRLHLRLYENGNYILISDYMFGTERYTGIYIMNNDTIVLNDNPLVKNKFMSKKIIKANDKIYFLLKPNGKYDKDFYYFEID